MSYSKQDDAVDSVVYGRKIIREQKEQKRKQERNRKILFYIFLLVMFFLGLIIGLFTNTKDAANPEIVINDLKMYGEDAEPIIFNNYDLDLVEYQSLNVPLDDELQEFIFDLSTSYGIDSNFVMALIYAESSFRTNIKSNTNDYGLMQINERNHEWLSKQLGIEDFNEPYQNVRAGVYILRLLFDKYDDPHKVLMAYNMGENGAKRLWDKGVYQTPYSIKIINKSDDYRMEIKKEETSAYKTKNISTQTGFHSSVRMRTLQTHTQSAQRYDDRYFHENVIPKMECEKCAKTAGDDYRPLGTKYPDGYEV